MKPTALNTNKMPSLTVNQLMDRAIELAITEDLGAQLEDPTSDSIVGPEVKASGAIYCKQPGVIVGLEIVEMVLKRFDENIFLTTLVAPGTYIEVVPAKIAEFSGPAAAILKAERLALNLLQRMSGIATITKLFVDKTGAFGHKKKTTPCLRVFERVAVASAGGTNHRFGLYDAVLIKDNHVRLAKGVKPAVAAARKANPQMTIEVETTTLEEVRDAVEIGADRILLDNMTPELVRQSVQIIGKKAYIEVSGGINLSNIEKYLIDGVNGISIGALTHSAPGLDISLEVETFV